jgi:hypothetical protein
VTDNELLIWNLSNQPLVFVGILYKIARIAYQFADSRKPSLKIYIRNMLWFNELQLYDDWIMVIGTATASFVMTGKTQHISKKLAI